MIWYIWKIWCIFGIFLKEGLVKTLNQCICYLTKRKQGKHGVVKLISKTLVILCNMEASGLAENKTGRELRSSKNTELGFKYTIFVSQSGRSPGCRSRGGAKITRAGTYFNTLLDVCSNRNKKVACVM